MDNHFIGCLELNLSDNIQERVPVTPWGYLIQPHQVFSFILKRETHRDMLMTVIH